MNVLGSLTRPRSLSARLVATAVGLVLLVSLLLAGATAVALQRSMQSQVDQRVLAALGEFRDHGLRPRGDQGPGPGFFEHEDFTAVVSSGGKTEFYGPAPDTDAADLRTIAHVDLGSDVRSLELSGHHYRVVAVEGVDPTTSTHVKVVFFALSDRVGVTVKALLLEELAFIALGVGVASLAGYYLVRRQLRPLREVADTAHQVAELPLASGAVEIPDRVPDRLTDERTEVGQVGSALNTLLGHVEEALGARHRSEQQVRQFVADASHELRTPLATIKGYAELARRTHAQEPPELLRTLEKVEAEGVRMTSLVEDLLLLARLDAGRPLAHDEVDLTRLVLEAVSDARVVTPDHRWRLQLPDDPVDVPGDELRIRQVIDNLLSNAARHTAPGTTVTVTVDLEGSGSGRPVARVYVHDDGPGVPDSLQPTVFERFTRADSARTREVGGAGLGLSLARAIARAHDGDLAVESRPGATTFTLTLPATAVVPAGPVPASQSR